MPLRLWILRQPVIYLLCSSILLGLDIVTGPFLQFPILFVIPVSAAAWYVGPRLAYGLAVALPLGRLAIAWLFEPSPVVYMIVNCLCRIAVLALIAYLVRRIVIHAGQMESRLNSLVTICAWSRTVEYEGEWLSFEEYLERRFGLHTTHGISPEEALQLRASAEGRRSTPQPGKPASQDPARQQGNPS